MLAPTAASPVGDWMTPDPVTVTIHDSCLWALRVLQATGSRQLIVLDGDRIVGILTRADIYRRAPARLAAGAPDPLLAHVSVAGVMTYFPVRVERSQPVRDAVRAILDNEIGALPVVDGERLVGIFTERDAVRVLDALLGSPGGTDSENGPDRTDR